MVVVNVFGYLYWPFEDVQNCNLSNVVESYYDDVRNLLAEQTSLASCKTSELAIFKLVDRNGDHIISRCEHAAFLVGVGNDLEYAQKYSEIKTLPHGYNSCYTRFGYPSDLE